jgi:glycosyltransferase involved in cell wall biosynthesis
MSIFANYGLGGAVLNLSEEIQVYPIGLEAHGADIIASHASHVKADIVITLYDAWVFRPEIVSRFRWIPWLPVDHNPLPERIKLILDSAWQPIVYSRFGEAKLKEAGLEPHYVPHGIETDVFKPGTAKECKKARERLKIAGDTFVATMVAANKGTPSRKSYPEALWAWKQFNARHPDSILYLHTHSGPEMTGIDLPLLIHQLGLPDSSSIAFCDPYWNLIGFPDSYMREVYLASDVLLNPAMGEGFGLPIVEAQACGRPVIVGDNTAQSELCFAGWKVPGQPFWTPVGAWQFVPSLEAIIESLEEAYKNRGSTTLAKKAREGAMAYDADAVVEQYWKPVLEQIEGEVSAGNVLEPVVAEDVL